MHQIQTFDQYNLMGTHKSGSQYYQRDQIVCSLSLVFSDSCRS